MKPTPTPHAAPGVRPLPARLEQRLLAGVGAAVALMLAIEIVLLTVNVVMRYFLHLPLGWADELATILFIWISMLGATLAHARGKHMAMTTLVERGSPALRGHAARLGLFVPLWLLSLFFLPSVDYALHERFVVLPALNIAATWKAGAIPVGVALMWLVTVSRVVQGRHAGTLLAALVALAVSLLLGETIADTIEPWGHYNLLIFFVVLVAIGVLSGLPIAFAFFMGTLCYLNFSSFIPLSVVAGRMDEGMSHIVLLAVPLFIVLGYIMEMTGMARVMIDFLAGLLGHVRGGLQYVLIGAMYLVSGISGSKTADMAAVAPVLVPEMTRRGARRGELVALLAATGAQTETVPPSIVLITVGAVAGVSIAALFVAGILPSILLGLTLCAYVGWRNRREQVTARRPAWRLVLKSFVVAVPVLALPLLIRAAVMGGAATATEVSTLGIVYSLIIGALIYRHLDCKRLIPMLIESATLSGAVLFIIGTATSMAWALTQSGFSSALAQTMASMPGGAMGFLLVSILTFVILGSVLEGVPAIVLLAPLLFPIARDMGIHEVHYAIVVILAMGLGLFAPPFGVGYYSAAAVTGIAPGEGTRPMAGYLLVLLVGIVLIAAVPWISIGFL